VACRSFAVLSFQAQRMRSVRGQPPGRVNFSLDNLTNRDYYETQNYFESRVAPDAPAVARIHGTPGFPLTAVAGVTLRFRGK
jgi:hypothetical protein